MSLKKEAQSLPPEQYTVGWICAIYYELSAARAMFDEEHAQLRSQPKHDENNYTLGRIGEHCVVVTCLPEYGTNRAAIAAKSMQSTFPNLRFGLMVGVGGGVPSEDNDIRLGDVAVSLPSEVGGGVIQYDLGRMEVGEFRRLGALNKPPVLLRTAITSLRATRNLNKQLSALIDETFQEDQESDDDADEMWTYPGAKEDILFSANYIHVSGKRTCQSCSNDAGPNDVAERSVRKTKHPRIHYGNIASGNTVMKNGLKRDEIAQTDNVICFEMEAAGLMDDFPCLVIRGICDYADSHKNKQWQPYAAATAAAYAKNLLSVVSPGQVEQMEPIVKLLSQVQEDISDISSKTKSILHHQHNETEKRILDWLTPMNYGSQQSDYLSLQQPGTGQWFLMSEQYKTWKSTKQKTLFCPGIPGAGKTVLTSIVVDDLMSLISEKSDDIGLAYVYCNFRRGAEQRDIDLLSSLFKQLCQARSPLPDVLRSLYEKHEKVKTRPSVEEIATSLRAVANLYSKVFIIVDALDECQIADGQRRKFLSHIFNIQEQCGANIFATSRFIPDIVDFFKDRKSISLEVRADPQDVDNYLESNIKYLPDIVQNDPILKKEIKTEILEAVNGMFLLVKIYLQSLGDKLTLNAIRDALKVFRKRHETSSEAANVEALGHAYREAMERINSQPSGRQNLAINVLSWITCAMRPLSTWELRHALATKPGQFEINTGDIFQIGDMVSSCAGLVTVDEQSDIIRLVHYTTQEYFEKTQEDWFPDAHVGITTVCLTYLSFDVFDTGFCRSQDELKERMEANKFFRYAAAHWLHHAEKATTLRSEIVSFALSGMKLQAASQGLLMNSRSFFFYTMGKRTAVHLAAYLGVEEVLKILLTAIGPDLEDSRGRTPLSYAAESGHTGIVKLLLAAGVNVNSANKGEGKTPLSFAAQRGHEAVVEILLTQPRIDPNSKAEPSSSRLYYKTPLVLAAKNGYEKVVQLLLADPRVDQRACDDRNNTALAHATMNGHEATVQLLLQSDKGISQIKTNRGDTPLILAAGGNNANIVQLLLRIDPVNLNAKNNNGGSALSEAAKNDCRDVVKLLLAQPGIDIETKDNLGATPLLRAAQHGHCAIVNLLLARFRSQGNCNHENSQTLVWWTAAKGELLVLEDDNVEKSQNSHLKPLNETIHNNSESIRKLLVTLDGLDLNSRNELSQTPLNWAAANGQTEVVRLLLKKKDINCNSQDKNNQTPLGAAVANNHTAIVELLLTDNRVYPGANDKNGQTPLSQAAICGHKAIVQLFLAQSSVDPDAKDNDGRTPLSWAIVRGHEAIVQLLLVQSSVDLDAKDEMGRTPLSYAAEHGYETTVRLLLAQGSVDPDTRDKGGRTPLLYAAERGHKTIVYLLLAQGSIDPDTKDKDGRTPLSWAVEHGHEAIVQLFLAQGSVDPDAKDKDGRTPLSRAAEHGHEAIVQLLLVQSSIDLDAKDKNGRTPLFWAAVCGHKAIVQLLLVQSSIDLDAKDKNGRTPLFWAAVCGHEAIVQLLLAQDSVDLDAKDKDGRTPLSWAAEYGYETIVRLLLAQDSVDPDARDENGRTPLSWAANIRSQGCEMVVKALLLSDRVEVNARDKCGWSPLIYAAYWRKEEMVRLLLAVDAIDVNINSETGDTALMRAVEQGYRRIIKLLLKKGSDVECILKQKYFQKLRWTKGGRYQSALNLLRECGASVPSTYDL